MQFSFSNKLGYIQQLFMENSDAARKLSLAHVVNSLTFGDASQQSAIRKGFGNNEHTMFDMMELVDDNLYAQDVDSSKDYFYFLKLVPHIFVDEVHLEEYRSYSYSLNHNSKVKLDVKLPIKVSQMAGFPVINIIYDFAPINMKITKQDRDLARFLVNVSRAIKFTLFKFVVMRDRWWNIRNLWLDKQIFALT